MIRAKLSETRQKKFLKQALENSHSNIWHVVVDASKLWYRLDEKQLSLLGSTEEDIESSLRVLNKTYLIDSERI